MHGEAVDEGVQAGRLQLDVQPDVQPGIAVLGQSPDEQAAALAELVLRGTSYAEFVSAELKPFHANFREQPGGSPAKSPDAEPFWVATSVGAGQRALEWDKRHGAWSLVVMRLDGGTGLDVRASIGSRFGFLLPVGVGGLVVGSLLLGWVVGTRKVHGGVKLMALLTGVAGWVDAVAYVRAGAVFVANQTGNAVFLAVRVAHRWFPGTPEGRMVTGHVAFGPLASLAGFCLGVAASVLPLRRSRRSGDASAPWVLLAVETVLLACAALTSSATRETRLGLAAAAMGVQSVYAAGVAMRGVSTTTLTGTVVALISAFADEPGRTTRRGLRVLGTVWAAYVVGAWGGAATTAWRWPSFAAYGAAAIVTALATVAVLADRHGRAADDDF
jgi:uncharacterized membrane protein YoaK (UPF0700 family)